MEGGWKGQFIWIEIRKWLSLKQRSEVRLGMKW